MKRIGILTFHQSYNYGAVLQAYALCAALKNHDVKYIDYIQPNIAAHCEHSLFNKNDSFKVNLKHFIKHFILRNSVRKENKFKNFINEYIPLTKGKYFSFDQLCNIDEQFDVLISGSDQIWNPQFTGNKFDLSYFLAFDNNQARKISYATSAGSYCFDEVQKGQISNLLKGYQDIGVRELFLQKQLSHINNKNIKIVLDPTLLLDRIEWRRISTQVTIRNKYVLLYTFDNCKTCEDVAKKIAEKLKCKVISITQNVIKSKGIDKSLSDVGPCEFLWLFDNAEFVVTNSFHGTAFSVIFRKNFFSIWKKNNPHRALNLLDAVDLKGRLIKDCSDIKNLPIETNYDFTEKKLAELRDHSYTFLENAIR